MTIATAAPTNLAIILSSMFVSCRLCREVPANPSSHRRRDPADSVAGRRLNRRTYQPTGIKPADEAMKDPAVTAFWDSPSRSSAEARSGTSQADATSCRRPGGRVFGDECARHAQAKNLGETMVERTRPAQDPRVLAEAAAPVLPARQPRRACSAEDVRMAAGMGELQVLGDELDVDEPAPAVLHVPQAPGADLLKHLPAHVQDIFAKRPGGRRPSTAPIAIACSTSEPRPGISRDDTGPGEGQLLPGPGGGPADSR